MEKNCNLCLRFKTQQYFEVKTFKKVKGEVDKFIYQYTFIVTV